MFSNSFKLKKKILLRNTSNAWLMIQIHGYLNKLMNTDSENLVMLEHDFKLKIRPRHG